MARKQQISIDEATHLANASLQRLGYDEAQANIISDHLIDSERRGFGIAGLARILSIGDRLKGSRPVTSAKITRDAPATAQIDGQDTLGYLVGHEATKLAIEKCKASGVSVVGANGTWYTEMATANDLVTVIASNCTPWVAPYGTHKPLLGTNPFCIGIPASKTPIIYDIGTSKIIHAEVMLARRLGQTLPEDVLYDENGKSVTDPNEAFNGPGGALSAALAVWGGAKGSGLSLAVQLLGIVAGSPALPSNLEDFGFLVMMVNPAMFRPIEESKAEVEKMREAYHEAPTASDEPLRVPFERSDRVRKERRERGWIEVDEGVVEKLNALKAMES